MAGNRKFNINGIALRVACCICVLVFDPGVGRSGDFPFQSDLPHAVLNSEVGEPIRNIFVDLDQLHGRIKVQLESDCSIGAGCDTGSFFCISLMNGEPVTEFIEIWGTFVAGEGRLRDSFDAPVGGVDIRSRFRIGIAVIIQVGRDLFAAMRQRLEGLMRIGNLFQEWNTGIGRGVVIRQFKLHSVMGKFIQNGIAVFAECDAGIVAETVVPLLVPQITIIKFSKIEPVVEFIFCGCDVISIIFRFVSCISWCKPAFNK